MSFRQRLIPLIVCAVALSAGGGCLCWLTGDCDERLTPPSSPSPADGSADMPTSLTLSWNGGDPPNGKTVRQDLYLGATYPPRLFRPSIAGKSIRIDSLAQARTYYWQLILIEENGRNLAGPIWSFTTEFPPAFMSVQFPNWATNWSLGESRSIEWRSAYAGSQVRIELYKSGLNLFTIASATQNDGLFNWEMNNAADRTDPDYRIKITSLLDENLYDYSDFFTVVLSCPIEVTTPHLRDMWVANELRTILWRPLGVGTGLKVALSLYKGSDYQYLIAGATLDDGMFGWVVNDYSGGSGQDYRVRITDLGLTGCTKFSDFFSIQACPVTVSSPASGDIWPLGTQHTVVWDPANLPDTLTLELYQHGEFVCVLDEEVPNTGAYLWTVARCHSLNGEQFQLKLFGGEDGLCGFSGSFDLH